MSRDVRVFAFDPDFLSRECDLKFTLTYEGALQTGGSKSVRKHQRRRVFHQQLKRLWEVSSLLKHWMLSIDECPPEPAPVVLAKRFGTLKGFEFVPLISEAISVEAALHFNILRPTTFKGETRDIDNIVKTLMDSLRRPQVADELPKSVQPESGEQPFFVLLQDDRLVSKITSTADELLQPIEGKHDIHKSDARVIIDVYIRPNYPTKQNIIFFSDDFEVWNNKWAEGIPEDLRGWSNAELKARTTQCVLRMRVAAEAFRMQNEGLRNSQTQYFGGLSDDEISELSRRELMQRLEQSSEQSIVWNGKLRPVALALKEELLRRIYGEPPYPRDHRMSAIDIGTLAGPNPIQEATNGLESLIRQLP